MAQADAGFHRIMKFKKGHYYIDDTEVPIGSEYIAHCMGWTKSWIKFKGGTVAERRIYRMLHREITPDRTELDDLDVNKWETGLDGRPKDPWVLQFLLPLENRNGDLVIFVTSSYGGKRAVSDLCSAWGRKAAKQNSAGTPIVHLHEVMMPTKKFGDVPRPHFEIVGWDAGGEPVREVNPNELKGGTEEEMNDEIPF